MGSAIGAKGVAKYAFSKDFELFFFFSLVFHGPIWVNYKKRDQTASSRLFSPSYLFVLKMYIIKKKSDNEHNLHQT